MMPNPILKRPLGAAAATLLAVASSIACGAPAADSLAMGLPALTLAEPALEIGVVEGADEYTFGSVDGVLRMADGSIAVSDAVATRISLFRPDGTFIRSWGARGEGPGEFRTLSRIYRHGADSLMAADAATARVSFFGLDGGYTRQVEGFELARDSTFRLDSWLYGRFWLDGALTGVERDALKAVIDRLPPPRGEPGYRRGIVTRDGSLLLREGDLTASGGRIQWVLLDPTGRPMSVIDTPSRFTPLDVGDGEMVGSWLGPADVSFVRVYPIVEADGTRPVPSWLTGDSATVTAAAGPTDEEFQELMRESIRGMAIAQEIHYAGALTYTTALDSLERFDPPEGLGAFFTHATARGWAAVFTHPTADRLCGIAYGAGGPPGWQMGAINCGPPSSQPDRGS